MIFAGGCQDWISVNFGPIRNNCPSSFLQFPNSHYNYESNNCNVTLDHDGIV